MCACVTRSAVGGQYRTACGEVVSDFIKELIVRIGFFNQKQKDAKGAARLSAFISQDLLKMLTKSLCSSQDFLRSLPLTFPLGFGSYESAGLIRAHEYVRP